MKLGAPEPIAALNRVRIVENGEPLVDIRAFCPEVEVVEKCCPYLRRTVAARLSHAASLLPPDHRFRVGTVLRTLPMQQGGWDGYFQRMKDEHPDWPLSALRRATNRYFAPYNQPAPPGHCTGGAVDVQILGPDGEPLDVTSPTQGWEAAYTWSDRIGPEAKRNRMVMVSAMLKAGFTNCREEFWHYSWGDSAWAVRVGESVCPYGLVEPPVALEADHAGGCAVEIHPAGNRAFVCRPDGARLDVCLLWAAGKEAVLRIEWPAPALVTLYRSENREQWEPVMPEHRGDALHLVLAPASDRVYIASEIPAPPPTEPPQDSAPADAN